jgi:H+/gluconate symporter-like permease
MVGAAVVVVAVVLPPPPPLHAASNSTDNVSALRINLVMVVFICNPVLLFASHSFFRFILKVGTKTCPPCVTSKNQLQNQNQIQTQENLNPKNQKSSLKGQGSSVHTSRS